MRRLLRPALGASPVRPASTRTLPLRTVAGDAALAAYSNDGHATFRGALSGDLLGEVREHVEWLSTRPYLADVPPDHWHHPIMRNDPFWVRLISDKQLLDIAELFLGPDIASFSSHYFCKMPGSPRGVPWHQDGSYYPLWPMSVVTVWLAVDRSDAGNGCLQVVKGTHQLPLAVPGGSNGNAGMGTHTSEEVARLGLATDVELEPGDASVHHPNLVHGSGANNSQRRRCGLSVRYMSTSTHCFVEEQPVLLLRGNSAPGVNHYRSWPKYRPGYDMPFQNCEQWNSTRYKDPADEAAYFSRTDYGEMEREIRADLGGFVDEIVDL